MTNKELFQMASKLKEECLKRPKCGECPFAYEWADRSACALDGEPDQWELAEVEIVSEVRKDVTDNRLKEQEPCEDAITRILKRMWNCRGKHTTSIDKVKMEQIIRDELSSVNPQEPKTGHCKDCKWWKDSDGLYRRGSHAESQCPINRREVFEGNGYCYMFEPQESEVNNG